MRKLLAACLYLVLAIGVSSICSCGSGGSRRDATYQPPDPLPFPTTKELDFSTSFPIGSDLNSESLKIMSFYKISDMPMLAERPNNAIPVTVTDTDRGQLVILADAHNNPLFFSYVEPTATVAIISSEEIAKAFIWINPYVLQLPADQQAAFLDEAVLSPAFPQLMSLIDDLLIDDSHNLLDPNSHPEVVTTAFVMVRETFENMSPSSPAEYKDVGKPGHLRVLDKDGNDLSFENPYMTGYGVEWVDS